MRKTLFTTLMVAAPKLALACPVCFGESDSPMAAGTNAGIWLMLGFVAIMLTGFASFFVYLIRRAKKIAALQQAEGTT
ncbi:MAG TPA: hypothetical protein VFA59_08615 [Vicinamibacterales bacterium]|nr:hypothetical protein [Vicinamibacterales bacterium]